MATDDATATFGLPALRRFSETALAALGSAREEIDALNVYPVPDGDTGTNLFLTLESAHAVLTERPDDDLPSLLLGYARGALLGARGNSGVILSQLVGAFVRRLLAVSPGERASTVLVEGLRLAADAAYAAVDEPVEGTILTVAREAAESAEKELAALEDGRAESRDAVGRVITAAAEAARRALERTPEQLAVLRRAGVVDAGGRGLCVILDAAETALTGRRPSTGPPTTGPNPGRPLGQHRIPVPLPTGDLAPGGPAYEVMYLLEAADDAVPGLRRALAQLGDSLVVVGGDGLWNVHVHVDDVGAAVEAGIEAGRPYRIRVTHFADQARAASAADDPAVPGSGRAVVAVAAGEGLGRLFAEAGAVVVPGAPRRPSTGDLVAAVRATGAREVVVLPNDRDSLAVAEAAVGELREELGVHGVVVPTVAQVQGLAALAVHEPGRPFEADVLQMTSAARHARSGAVTVAVRRAITTGGPCEPGDVLGAVEGDFVVVGSDLHAVAVEVVERLLGGGGELVTLVAGADGAELAERCTEHLASHHPTVDVVVYDGGQERYPLLLGVE